MIFLPDISFGLQFFVHLVFLRAPGGGFVLFETLINLLPSFLNFRQFSSSFLWADFQIQQSPFRRFNLRLSFINFPQSTNARQAIIS